MITTKNWQEQLPFRKNLHKLLDKLNVMQYAISMGTTMKKYLGLVQSSEDGDYSYEAIELKPRQFIVSSVIDANNEQEAIKKTRSSHEFQMQMVDELLNEINGRKYWFAFQAVGNNNEGVALSPFDTLHEAINQASQWQNKEFRIGVGVTHRPMTNYEAESYAKDVNQWLIREETR